MGKIRMDRKGKGWIGLVTVKRLDRLDRYIR